MNSKIRKLQALFGESLRLNAPLAEYTSAHVGGPALALIEINRQDELLRAVRLMWDLDLPYRIIGFGSKLLVADSGYAGVILINRSRQIDFEASSAQATVRADSGTSLIALAKQCAQLGLSGLEWCGSIPGTVGGAVYGNAGAHGSDTAACLLSARILTRESGLQSLENSAFDFHYRNSRFKAQAENVCIVDALFALTPGDPAEINAKLSELSAQRQRTQPPGPSFGSTFKNPPDNYAGKLLESVGLKGYCIGHASYSLQHANFILNDGQANASDYYQLIRLGQQRVQEQYGIQLQLEVEPLGDFDHES